MNLDMSRIRVVSLAAVFWMSRNVPPNEGTLRDIQKTAARETRIHVDWYKFDFYMWMGIFLKLERKSCGFKYFQIPACMVNVGL